MFLCKGSPCIIKDFGLSFLNSSKIHCHEEFEIPCILKGPLNNFIRLRLNKDPPNLRT